MAGYSTPFKIPEAVTVSVCGQTFPQETPKTFSQVRRRTGPLCVLAVKIDIIHRFLRYGFGGETSGGAIFVAETGGIRIHASHGLLERCRPSDCVVSVGAHSFALILRKVGDSGAYTLVGPCEYAILQDTASIETKAVRQLADWQ